MTDESMNSDEAHDLEGLESGLFLVAKFLLAFCVGLAFVSAFYLTLELDEAWIFGATKQWVAGTWEVPEINPTLTSGGLHFLLQALTSWLVGYEHYFVRIVSVGYFLFLAASLSRLFDLSKPVRNGTLILLAAVLSVPGVLLHSSLAFSTVLATALFLSSLVVWTHYPAGSVQRRVFTGLMLGLTIATRLNLLPVLPVLIVFALRPGEFRLRELKDAILICVIAVATMLVSHFLQTFLTNPSYGLADLFWQILKVSGLWDKSANAGNPLAAGNGIWPYLRLWVWFDRWQLATQQFPFWMMVLGSAYAWAPLENLRSSRDTTILQFLIAFSWLSWVSWIVLSPLPWYRYLLPALIGFAAVFGHLVLQMYLLAVRYKRNLAFMIPLFVVAVLLNSAIVGVRHLRLGDANRLVREYSGVMGVTNNFYAPFQAERQQRDLVEFVREKTGQGDTVVIAGGEFEQYPVAFRSGRVLIRLEEAIKEPVESQWVIVPPGTMNAETRLYLGPDARAARQIGSYVIFERRSPVSTR
jgi:hypothetical protein